MADLEATLPNSNHNKKSKKSVKSKLLWLLILLILLALAGGVAFLYTKYAETRKEVEKLSTVQGQQELSKTQTQELLGEMRQIIIMPTNEDPVVATITDINQLKDKDFYKDAKNGDRVVVFANAKKAYIYSPERKLIVNVGAFQIEEKPQNQQPTNNLR